MRLRILFFGMIISIILIVTFITFLIYFSGLMDLLIIFATVGEAFHSLSQFFSAIAPWIPWNIVFTLVGLMVSAIIVSSILKRFSRDTCLTEFEDYHVTVILPDETGDKIAEAFFGRLLVPPAAGGGFEVFYDPIQVESLDRLLEYLRRIHNETAEEKYLNLIQKIEAALKERPSLAKVRGHHVDYVEASRKVYASDVDKVLAILRFHRDLSEEEKARRIDDFVSFFHPSFIRRKARELRCALNTVRDKVNQLVVAIIGATSAIIPTPKGVVDELTKEVKKVPPGSYEALLENSLGRVVNVEITDHLNRKTIQHAVLKEYTAKFLTLYQARYPLRKAVFLKGSTREDKVEFEIGYLTIDIHGKIWERPDLEIRSAAEDEVIIKNITKSRIKILTKKGPIELAPGETATLEFTDKIEYEITAEADIVLPRKRARVIGLGEPIFD